MRFTQLALIALAPLAFAQVDTETIADVVPTPDVDVPSPEVPSDVVPTDVPTPTEGGITDPSEALDSISSLEEEASSAASSLEDVASSLVSSSIEASITEADASLSSILENETDSSILASASSARDALTQSDDDNAAARPTGVIAAGALFGGAAILANL